MFNAFFALIALFSVVFMWSLRSTPKNFVLAFLSTPYILSFGRARDRLSFWVLLRYRENTIFFVLSDNLFTLNHSFIFCSSKFALEKRVLMFLSEINRFVSSAKIVVPKASERFFRSLMYKINNNGPRIDPWGRTYWISWNDVFSLLLITTHWFWLLR